MKILVLGRGLPGPGQPLLGIFEYQQARALAAAGHEVVYGALDIRFLHHRRPWGIRRMDLDGVHVVELSLPLGRLQYRGGYRLVRGLWGLLYRACVRAHGHPDVVHSHFVGWSAAAALAKPAHGYPLVVTEHTSGLMAPNPPRRMLRGISIAYAAADVLIAVSPALARRIRELTGHDAVYVPNLVDTGTFAGVHPAPRPGHLVTVGNLIERKRVDVLLEAVACLAAAGRPELTLTVVGTGPERAALQARAQALGIADRVTFTGGLEQRAIAELLASAAAFALASREETFGVVLIEAMAAGVPVVSTRSGGPDGFVTAATGVLTGFSAQELADGLAQALGRDWDRETIRDYAVRHHSPAVIAARLIELYETAVARWRGTAGRPAPHGEPAPPGEPAPHGEPEPR